MPLKSFVDELRERAIEEGLEQGREQGLEQGRGEATGRLVDALVLARFPDAEPSERRRVVQALAGLPPDQIVGRIDHATDLGDLG